MACEASGSTREKMKMAENSMSTELSRMEARERGTIHWLSGRSRPLAPNGYDDKNWNEFIERLKKVSLPSQEEWLAAKEKNDG
jgi:hypothetical protein